MNASEPPEFAIDLERRDDADVVNVHGEVDLDTAPRLREAIGDLTGTGRPVVIDLTDVGFLDSSGLAALLDARSTLTRNRGRLVVVCPPPLQRIFELAGVTDLLELRPPSS